MVSMQRPHVSKIPGGGMPLAKRENHIKDLTKLTQMELLEIKEREGKLLANKSNLQRLPDKGKRIQDFCDKVLAELERRSNVDEAAALFSELNIANKGRRALNQLEWSGRLNETDKLEAEDPTEDVIDSDDEMEMNPLRLLAQRTMHERRVKVLPPEQLLITAADLEEIKSFNTDSPDSGLSTDATRDDSTSTNENQFAGTETDTPKVVVDAEIISIDVIEKLSKFKPKLQQVNGKPHSKARSKVSDADSRCSTPASDEVEQHVRYLVDKTELMAAPQREKYKPYQTTTSNVHDPEKERLRKKGKNWEVTAATPPLIQHGATKMLTLMDSVEIQVNYLAKLKKLQETQTAERLAAKFERLGQRKIQLPSREVLKTNTAFTAFRTPTVHIEGEQDFNEDEQVHDPLDEEKPGGGVTYTVFD